MVLVREGRVLLGHRHPDRRWYPGCWDLIGGHVEAGETPEAAARRECLEEVGVVVDDLRPLALASGIATIEVHAFTACSWRGEPTNCAPDEHDELRWFAPEELGDVPLADPAMAAGLVRALGVDGRGTTSEATPDGSGPAAAAQPRRGRHTREPWRPGGPDALPRFRRMTGGLGWRAYALAVLAILGLVVGWLGWPAFPAALGRGTPGTFTAVTDNGCSGRWVRTCSWTGTYDSDDGALHLEKVLLEHDTPAAAGDRVAVLYEGPWHDVPTVYLAHGDRTWIPIAVIVVVSGLYLLAFCGVRVFALALARRDRRVSPPVG